MHAGLTAVAAVAVAGAVVVGGENAFPAGDVRLGSGAAWLASARVGQISLLDGSSAEVAAQVQVAAAGNVLEVAQQGAIAYAVDQTTGTLRRVDGATFDMTPAQSPIPDARAGLTAIPGNGALYTLDSRRGILANVDPGTLSRRGELLSLAPQLSPDTATVDEAGTLWAIDNATGDLVRVAGGSRSVRRGVARPGRGVLAMAGGRPVVVDQTNRAAIVVDRDTGRVRDTVDVDLRPDDTVEVSGSARAHRLYLVVSRGVLIVCELDRGGCGTVIPLSSGRFGAAVEAEGRLFVPNYTTGQVWVIDIDGSRVVAKASVLSPDTPFQLIARDGVVFYNDTASERAGVVRLDGSVVPVTKYDPDNPAKGLTAPRSDPGEPPVGANEPPTDAGEPPRDPGQPPGDSTEPPRDSGEPPSDPGEPTLRIVMTNTSPTVDEVVTLEVDNTSGDAPIAARWTFGDGERGEGVRTSHKWAAARDTYLVAVVATLPDGSERTTSVTIPVTETPRFTLTLSIPDGGGRISVDGTNCPPTCQVAVEPDTRLTLTATPDPTHTVGTWAGVCAGQSGNTCDITMNADQTAAHRFDPVAQTANLTVDPVVDEPENGLVTIQAGGAAVACPPTCTLTVTKGEAVELRANSTQKHIPGKWGGACPSEPPVCQLEMNKDETVTKDFVRIKRPPSITGMTCEQSGRTTFSCTVTQTNATQVRWVVDGQASDDVDNNDVTSGQCDFGGHTAVVTVSNPDGQASDSEQFICEPGLPGPR